MSYKDKISKFTHKSEGNLSYMFSYDGYKLAEEADKELEAKDKELKSRVAAYRLSVKSREELRRELEAKNKLIMLMTSEIEAKSKLITEINLIVNGFYADEGASLSSVFGKIRRLLKGQAQ